MSPGNPVLYEGGSEGGIKSLNFYATVEVNNRSNTFLSSLAIDIFSTVSILMGCNNKVKEAENAMKSLDEPKRNVTEMENKVKEYEHLIKREVSPQSLVK